MLQEEDGEEGGGEEDRGGVSPGTPHWSAKIDWARQSYDQSYVEGGHAEGARTCCSAASEQGGNRLKSFKDFYLKAKARIWP